jgi:hypothetical protein
MTGTTLITREGGNNMHPLHKDWIKVPLFLEELRGLFEELPDEELDRLKKIAIDEEVKRSSDRRLSNANNNTGTNVRG